MKKHHSKVSLKCHIILVCKYRKKLLQDPVSSTINRCFKDLSVRFHFDIIKMKSDIDHIHLLIEYSSNTQINNLIKLLKQFSTKEVWNLHGSLLRNHFWKKRIFWSAGYFVSSVGSVSGKVVEQYIENQGKAH
jgi:putative transposase